MRHSGALEAIDRILNRGGDADDVLRAVVGVLRERGGYRWAGVSFVEGERVVLGPHGGEPDEARRTRVAVDFRGRRVAELAVDGASDDDRAFLERVALLISSHCVVAWDTGGLPWEP
jgi:hypothetical protein